MKGSEKQIEWATKIRTEKSDSVAEYLEKLEAQNRMVRGEDSGTKYTAAQVREFFADFIAHPTAEESCLWIERRKMDAEEWVQRSISLAEGNHREAFRLMY